jgi:L-amino acid N-acyltransferase YncA
MISNEFTIRPIKLEDAKATLEVYKPYVENTVISFEYDIPSQEEWESRIKTIIAEYPWLVCEYKGEIIGYAYGSKHRYRTAYSWSAESTIYLAEKFHRKGIARVLYETLFNILRLQGYVNVYAGVTVPNAKSEEFHQALGFYEVGTFKKIGFKFGAWHDTRWFQLHLADHNDNPVKPKTINEIQDTQDFMAILETTKARLSVIAETIRL